MLLIDQTQAQIIHLGLFVLVYSSVVLMYFSHPKRFPKVWLTVSYIGKVPLVCWKIFSIILSVLMLSLSGIFYGWEVGIAIFLLMNMLSGMLVIMMDCLGRTMLLIPPILTCFFGLINIY